MMKKTKIIAFIVLLVFAYSLGFWIARNPSYRLPTYSTKARDSAIEVRQNDTSEICIQEIIDFTEEVNMDNYRFNKVDTSNIGEFEGELIITLERDSIIIPFKYNVVE